MRISDRYLMREVLAAVLIVLLAFLVLFAFFNFLDELRSVGRESYDLMRAAAFVALGLPSLVYELIPIATLIGALYALSSLARHSEITVLRASGMATSHLLGVLVRVAALLAVVTFLLGEAVVPFTERWAQEVRAQALSKAIVQQGLVSGLWIKDGRNFINIRKATPDARLEGVRVYHFSHNNELRSVMDARSARFEPPGVWHLDEVVTTTLEGERASVTKSAEDLWQSAVNPDLLAVLMVAPERMSLFGLLNFTRHLTDNRQKTERYEIAIWKKLIYPLSVLVMVALALPFGYSHDRVGGVSLRIFAGVMLGIVFYALNGLFSNLGVINGWAPLASAIAPSGLFFLAAVSLLWWVERR